MLKINNLNVSYGGIKALQNVSMQVPEGKIVTFWGVQKARKRKEEAKHPGESLVF